jgi:hypothetical protein
VYAEIHQQRLFFDNRKDISQIIVLKIKTVSICIGASSTNRLLVLKKHQILNFWWYFKISQAICFWANFGKFWQFWANSTTLPMVDNMPLDGLKT